MIEFDSIEVLRFGSIIIAVTANCEFVALGIWADERICIANDQEDRRLEQRRQYQKYFRKRKKSIIMVNVK